MQNESDSEFIRPKSSELLITSASRVYCRVTGYGIREYGIRNTEYEIRSGLLDKYGDLKNVALPVV